MSADELLFDEAERGPSDDLRLQFEAASWLPEEPLGLDASRALEVAGYLEAVGADLYGVDGLPRRLRRGRMRVAPTGVVNS